MAVDSVTPLCTPAQFTRGAFKDLVRNYDPDAVLDLLIESTRICEGEADRRFAPFTITETQRAEGMDPDEYTDAANLPMDLQGTMGRSYALAIGASTLVRHVSVNQFAVRYPELWTYGSVSIEVYRSYGGNQGVSPAQIVSGPDPDSGHIWFQLGQFIPIGSQFSITYSGGYTVATPADLSRACKLMAAWLVVRELNPEDSNHDPDLLRGDALDLLSNYDRSS